MASCRCAPPARLHITGARLHLADGADAALAVVDEVWADALPSCSVCGESISMTSCRCQPCGAVICFACLSADTLIVECDCDAEVPVTGIQLAARQAAARLVR